MQNTSSSRLKVRDMTYIALMAALMAICSWISIPTTVPFTLQTFAIFVAVGLLGGRRGTLAVLVYILLGAIGVPVFSGFTGGIGILLGTTGGYIIGFLFSALLMWALEKAIGTGPIALIAAMVLGLVVCYAFGTAWFVTVYTQSKGAVTVGSALAWCVFPFIPFDLGKIALAFVVTKALKKYVAR